VSNGLAVRERGYSDAVAPDLERSVASAWEIGPLRAEVHALVSGDGSEEFVDAAVLGTSELLTNCLTHAADVCRLVVWYQPQPPAVRVEVHDRSSVTVQLAPVDSFVPSGRGLQVVAAVATRWGAEASGTGKMVWFEVGPPLTGGTGREARRDDRAG
jgi:hypothetical protein